MRPIRRVPSAPQGAARPETPAPWQREVSPDAGGNLLSPEALAFAASVRRAQRVLVKNKAYRATPIGGEVGRFLRSLRWSDASENTLLSYETTLARLAYDFAHLPGSRS